MKIQTPTVGPIVGYTSVDQTRIWLRGDFQATSDGYRRCFGVVRVKEKKGGKTWGDPVYTKLPGHFDMTGICLLAGLKPDTEYEYQAGWFFAETELDNLDETQKLEWDSFQSGSFRSGTASVKKPRSYVIGSCRYLLRMFGGLVYDERGDKVFESILGQIGAGQQVDALLMIGDQIYADDLNFLSPDTTLTQFLERYRAAFQQRWLRELMGRVPTYMVLDDHEIEDNWPSKASDKDWLTLYPNAIHAYQIYQCSHSPLFEAGKDGRISGTPDKFWYRFRDGCCDWFVMDSRNERQWNDDPAKRRMIKRRQMDALLAWLADGSGLAKMVVTSVPFLPDLESDSDDKWGGFSLQRTEILDFIFAKQIPKVAFLSGDVHCSFSIELTSPKDPAFKVISIISSSFFWPYPHMDDGDFVLSGALKSVSQNAYRVGKASEVHSTDNFSRITVDEKGMDIAFFERKGKPLGKATRRNF